MSNRGSAAAATFLGRTISFAQNFEDILLARVFTEASGFYIDIGANDPLFHNVTKLFHDRGWSGINIEPQPMPSARLRAERTRDVNLEIGISDREASLRFHQVLDGNGWSTFSDDVMNWCRSQGFRIEERVVPVRTLSGICDEYVQGRTIDFLKVDVEGFERQVILGGDWDKYRPRVVLLEAFGRENWEPLLTSRGYLFTVHDGVNCFYVREEDRSWFERLSTPVNCTDNAIPFEIVHDIMDLQEIQSLGPNAKRVARKLQSLSSKHPRLSRLAKRLIRLAG